ncbi:hypothetical protein FQN54_007751 [Arachnomyces sp. PD_36]|nr:hypothetical protein FQN54_007751 [Arachnomyces sp. PD_36]
MEKRYSAPHGALHVAQRDLSTANPQFLDRQYATYSANASPQQHSPARNSRKSLDPSISPPLSRRETPLGMSSPSAHRSGIPPPLTGRLSMTSMSPPLLDKANSQQPASEPPSGTESRLLPSREIDDVTIDDAYTAFILYCNPNVPLSVDTTELRKVFRTPPRSDGKNFSIFTLWELIGKLERKELKTWIQLAIELGVEPPSAEKRQSTQKVQQYAVRLKRWMRAMHVDAFFEYCLGNAHSYYTQLPSFNGSVSETRDGVPLEEDLALRALVPEWKPKRGRKRVEDKEHDDSKFPKRPHVDTLNSALDSRDHSAMLPQSAIPWSAYPDDTGHHDPWSAVSTFPQEAPASVGGVTPQPHGHGRGRNFRWRLNGRESSPFQYPQSAITPRYQEAESLPQSEPQSAIVQSSSEKTQLRRRHGQAVSSAWPSNAPTGRPRGRPPNNRTTQDGQFSTFSATPDTAQPTPSVTAARQSPNVDGGSLQVNEVNSSQQRPAIPFQPISSKPGKLQLQVPQRPGGPIRLATPPTVLVNGGNNVRASGRPTSSSRLSAEPTNAASENEVEVIGSNVRRQDRPPPPEYSLDDVALTFAERILRGVLLNRPSPFSPEEAKALAEEVILQLKLHTSNSLPPNALAVYCASYLGVGQRLGLGGNAPGPLTITANPSPSGDGGAVSYEIRFDSSPATGFGVNTTIKNLVIPAVGQLQPAGKNDRRLHTVTPAPDSLRDDLDDEWLDDSTLEATWKQKYLNLRKRVQSKEAAFGKYKLKVLETVMMDF